MTDHAEIASGKTVAYGRFSRRFRAFVIDWIILALLLVAALFAAVTADSNNVARILGIAFISIWILYEPILVSTTGSTIGHYLTNLRVVDDRTQGNVGFLKATARLLIKTVLGVYSFITMAVTSRHQAVHDLLTRSTVQVRDRSKASFDHYVPERTELSGPGRASRTRRVLMIIVYLFVSFVVYALALFPLEAYGLVSKSCISSGKCTGTENAITTISALIWLGAAVLLIVQGWKGKLYGCRRRIESKSP
jgi:uncharacterized RDD family membrane protein YckC